MGDDFRNVPDDRILNPAVWNAKEAAEIAAMTDDQFDKWEAVHYDPETSNPTGLVPPDFPDFVPPNGGSSNAPIIYDIQPRQGPPGTVVTLTGIRFLGKGPIQPPNTFEFNNGAGSFAIVSDTVIKATVPQGAIDGRVRIHSYDPTVPADVITYSEQSFTVLPGSVQPPPQSPADPSISLKWDTFDIQASGMLSGQVTVHASQPIEDVTIDTIMGQVAKSEFIPAGFFVSGHVTEHAPGVSKTTLINTGTLTGIGGVGVDLEGSAYVQATFKIGTKIKAVRKKIRIIRRKKPKRSPGATIVLDNEYVTAYVMPPTLNPMAKYLKPDWNEENDVSTVLTVIVLQGKIEGGQVAFKQWSQFGSSQQNSAPFKKGGKGLVMAMFANINFGLTEGWGAQAVSGQITIKADDGTLHTFPLGTGTAGALLPGSCGGGITKTIVNL